MNINKKFDRLKQWTNEKMGAEARTGLSDEFKALELEMNLRHEGMHDSEPCSNRIRMLTRLQAWIRCRAPWPSM